MVSILRSVSSKDDSQTGNKDSESPSISADGRYIAFASDANNLVEDDSNDKRDIFVYDRDTDTIEQISVSQDLNQSNNHSYAPSISNSGRFVTFQSSASNLVDNDSNQRHDVFVYDRDTRQVKRLATGSEATQSNGVSYPPSISGNGRFVTFQSSATNLVAEDTNNQSDVFVYDRDTNQVERVSIASDGTEGNGVSSNPHLSTDGRYVTFSSFASNLVEGDTNDSSDIFVYDRESNTTSRVSLGGDRAQGNGPAINPRLSADGRYVTFESKASNLVAGDSNNASDIFVYDRKTGSVERASLSSQSQEGNDRSSTPSISADGRYVTFASKATNLDGDDNNDETDIFVHDRQTQITKRVSLSSTGQELNGFSLVPVISADGRHIAFESSASSSTARDDSKKTNIFTVENPFLATAVAPLIVQPNNLLAITQSAAAQLKLSVHQKESSEVSEIVVISTDDELGTVEGKAPGDDGYLQAALIRSTVVFSTLEAREFSDFNPERVLDVTRGSFLQFAIITGGSLTDVLKGGSGRIIFATEAANSDSQSAVSLFAQSDHNLQLSFRLPGSKSYSDVVLNLTSGEFSHELGTQGQNAQNRIIDLTGSDKVEVTASIEVLREASLNNTVGFYEVEDEQGHVIDPMTGSLLAPDDPGYFQAALTHFANLSVTGQNEQMTSYTAQVTTDQRLSMFLIVEGTMDELMDTDLSNDPAVYFNHIGANADRRDHVRLLGDNTFGFEDTAGGGDMDFDDVVVKMSFE